MAGEEEKREGKGFTIQDRRRFSPDTGEARDNAPDRPATDEPQKIATESASKGEHHGDH